jgi:hypothetical protein
MLFAALTPPVPLPKSTSSILGDAVLVVVLGIALLGALLAGVIYLRRPRKHRRRRNRHGRKVYRETPDAPEAPEENPNAARRRFKYRYKRREHRSRNPTLADKGAPMPPTENHPTQGNP